MTASNGGRWFVVIFARRRRAPCSPGTPVLATLALMGGSLWALDAGADLSGATVFGHLTYPVSEGNYAQGNLFDPLYWAIPPGYGNSTGPTINLSAIGYGNFAWMNNGPGTIENPFIDSWYAEFSGSQLSVTFRNQNFGGALTGSRLRFQSDAFVGLILAQVGGDDFLKSGNGSMAATLVGDTITLEVGPQCTQSAPCSWPPDTYTNTYSLTPGVQLAAFSLSSSVVAGCRSVSGKVTLSAPAPAAGTVVTISDMLVSATSPVSVTVPAGATAKTFTSKTTPVVADENGTVSATLGAITLSQNLKVRPIGLSSVSLTPTSTAGGNQVTGKATLECNAGSGPITVDLSSNNAGAAYPVAASVVVPQGLKSANFDVATNAVLAKSSATISGTANGITKSRKLTVNVAAAVSPTSLKFGSVPVGTTSGPLNATLTNNGAVPFAVNGISLTGTAASWYAQTNNCPASLAPGASCTISGTFTPRAAAAKSAKLTIATSATATPLSVSLSGTGI